MRLASPRPNIEPDVEAIGPAEHRKPLLQCIDPGLTFSIVLCERLQHGDPPHLIGLLRARRERPRRGCAAEQRDEVAPLHSSTSSARPDSGSGMVRPSVLAVLRLMANSTFTACWTGSSEGLAPFRIFPT